MIKNFAFSLVGILFLASCLDGPVFKKKITDTYYVYSEDGVTYSLICKLGCKADATLNRLVAIHWNKSTMFLKTYADDTFEYHFIIAQTGELACCNYDLHIGPLTSMQVDSIRSVYQITEYQYKITLVNEDQLNSQEWELIESEQMMSPVNAQAFLSFASLID